MKHLKNNLQKKARLKFPIGTVVKIRESAIFISEPNIIIGLVVDYVEEAGLQKVLVMSSSKILQRRTIDFVNSATSIQRPYSKV